MIRTAARAAVPVTLLLLAAACNGAGDATPESAPATSTTTTSPAALVVDWDAPGLDVDLGDGFRARHCEGDAPLLCIERAGLAVGSVERLDFPAGDEMTLGERISDLYRSTTTDRAQGCPAGYRFETVEPEAAPVAGTDGLRYGFTGTFADGRPSEQTIGWMMVRDGSVTVIVAAADEPDGCLPPEGAGHFTTATLTAAAPGLERLVAGSRLPLPAVLGG